MHLCHSFAQNPLKLCTLSCTGSGPTSLWCLLPSWLFCSHHPGLFVTPQTCQIRIHLEPLHLMFFWPGMDSLICICIFLIDICILSLQYVLCIRETFLNYLIYNSNSFLPIQYFLISLLYFPFLQSIYHPLNPLYLFSVTFCFSLLPPTGI